MPRFSKRRYKNRSRGEKPKPSLPKLRIRVVAHRKGSEPETLWVTNDLAYAYQVAEALGSRAGLTSVGVQQATLENDRIRWMAVAKPTIAEPQQRPLQAGDLLIGYLDEEKTRQGGWKVAIALWDDFRVVHITNSEEVPADAEVNDEVVVRLTAANEDQSHLQIRWCSSSRILRKGGAWRFHPPPVQRWVFDVMEREYPRWKAAGRVQFPYLRE